MSEGPAFVLGNGPSLPVEHLHLLDGQFSCGVNRIARAYEPTAVLWCDKEIWEEERGLLEHNSSLLVTTIRNHPRRGKPHYCVKLCRSSEDRGNPAHFCASGSSGTAAARWALALGFSPVYLLGMSGEYAEDGRTNFWGRNERHGPKVRKMFADELAKLQEQYQHHVWRTDDPQDWALGPERSKSDWAAWLDERLTAAGVQVLNP